MLIARHLTSTDKGDETVALENQGARFNKRKILFCYNCCKLVTGWANEKRNISFELRFSHTHLGRYYDNKRQILHNIRPK